jgi:hypothetical protein
MTHNTSKKQNDTPLAATKDEYYTSDLDSTPDESPQNIIEEDDVPNTDLGGTINRAEIVDQDTTSARVGAPGHPGIDDDTG